MILKEIVEVTKLRVDQAKKDLPLNELKQIIFHNDEVESFHSRKAFAFEQGIKRGKISFICEIKRASPSKGLIVDQFPYQRIAKEYEQAGAQAISVLTEPNYFKGNDSYLKEISAIVNVPVLRKDFIIDEYQIYESKVLGADAVLLICSILDSNIIKKYLKICNELGLSALVEAHTREEVELALDTGARVIGVNNRNLNTFEVDLNNCMNLKEFVPPHIVYVAESGIKNNQDIKLLSSAGVDAVLIGETLMKSKNIKETLINLQKV